MPEESLDAKIRQIFISDLVLAKINGKHGLDREDVEDACDDVIDMGWQWDEERGWRLLVEGWARTKMRLYVVLYPTEFDGILAAWDGDARLQRLCHDRLTQLKSQGMMNCMDDDDMTPEEFRAALASSTPARRVSGPRPVAIDRLPDRTMFYVTAATIPVSIESQSTAAPIQRATTVVGVRRRAMVPAWVP